MKKLFSLLTLALLTMSAWAGNYVKVTSTADLTSGKYLIVYEDGNVAFNGALNSLDVASNTVAVTIENGVIAPKDAIIAAQFDIDVTAGTIKSASGYYIGQTSDANGMLTSTETAYTNTISITDGNADIKSSGNAYLRYNAASNQARFRYYKSSSYTGQKAIQLYKWDGEEDPVIGLMPPVFHPNGGEITHSTEVTLTCVTENADIFYWEGTEQEQSEWIHYNAPFYVNETKTFTAVSTKGNDISDYVTVTFTKVTPKCAKPTFTPGNGTAFLQGEELDVTINCATEGASIMYTVNDDVYEGTAPVVVTLTESATITAIASAEGYTDSDEATATYTMVVPETTGHIFNLVTDVTTLAAGDHIILVNATENGPAIAMGASRNNNFGGVDVVVNGNKVQTEKANIITLEKNGENWNLKANEGYLYAASSSANNMKAEQTVDEDGNANAAISIADNAAAIVFQGTNTRNNLRYNPNNGTPIFSCYEAGKQNPVYIYKTNEEIIEVTAPTFDPEGQNFDESITVTINAEEGANIKYSTDEKVTWNDYTTPLNITETTTVYAKAVKGEIESAVVSATYTKNEPVEAIMTLAEVNALVGENGGNVDFTFGGNAVVTAQQGGYLWLRDATGYGLIYGKINGVENLTFSNGQVLNPNWNATKTVYNGLTEYKDAMNVSASENTDTELAAPQEITELNADLVNAYVVVKNITSFTVDNRNVTANLSDGTTMVMYNQFNTVITNIPTEEGNYTVYGAVGRYAKGQTDQIQLYILQIDGAVTPPEPEAVDVYNFNEAYALTSGTKINMFNDVVVTYQKGNRLWVRDTEGTSGLIYGALNATFNNGDVLSDDWTAIYQLYNNDTPEFTNPEGIEASGDTREAAPYERTAITAANINEYIIMKGLTLLPDADNAKRFYNAADSLVFFNNFNVTLPAVEADKTYDVTGIVTMFNGDAQVYILEMTENAAPAGLRGDVNNDTFVNISDVTALIDLLLGGGTITNPAADCNQDSNVNISDVTTLIDFLLSGNWPNK